MKDLTHYLFSLLFGALGGVLILVIKSYTNPPIPPINFAVVDTQKIVEMQLIQSINEAANSTSVEVDYEKRATDFIEQLLGLANEVSTTHNLVLLSTNASLTKLPDLTDEFMQKLGLVNKQ